jgi:hypothetical protein
LARSIVASSGVHTTFTWETIGGGALPPRVAAGRC